MFADGTMTETIGGDPHHFYFFLNHHWHHRWGYYAWTYLHRGLATVHGVVRDADGRPVADASVVLRGAHGGVLKESAKHLTKTGPGGNFTMVAIRTGEYRVRAQVGKAAASTPVHLHPGQVASVSLKL